MRKVIMLNRVSIDGFFASANEATGGMDWFVQDPKVDKAVRALNGEPSDTLLLGAKTFKMFEKSWEPMLKDPKTPRNLRSVAEELTNMNKVVFSHTLKNTAWENSTFVAADLPGTVENLKRQNGENIMIMGSGTIVQQLANLDLIDEYIFILSPIIAGKGKPLFKDVKQSGVFSESSKSFPSGNVVLHYVLTPGANAAS